MKTTADHRDTRLCALQITQDANGLYVQCVDRTRPPRVVDGRVVFDRLEPLFIAHERLTQEQQDQLIAALTLLEQLAQGVLEEWEQSPERQRETLAAAIAAEEQIKLARKVSAELDAATKAKRAELERLEQLETVAQARIKRALETLAKHEAEAAKTAAGEEASR